MLPNRSVGLIGVNCKAFLRGPAVSLRINPVRQTNENKFRAGRANVPIESPVECLDTHQIVPRQWDTRGRKHKNAMGVFFVPPLTKLLIFLNCGAPPLGTISTNLSTDGMTAGGPLCLANPGSIPIVDNIGSFHRSAFHRRRRPSFSSRQGETAAPYDRLQKQSCVASPGGPGRRRPGALHRTRSIPVARPCPRGVTLHRVIARTGLWSGKTGGVPRPSPAGTRRKIHPSSSSRMAAR